MKTKFKLLALSASLVACGISVSSQANAGAYAFVANNIKDGQLATIVDGKLDTSGIYMSFGTPSSVSSSAASLNGSGITYSDSVSPPDAREPVFGILAANGTGTTQVRNNEVITTVGGTGYYTPFGALGGSYSWGDAKVVSEQSLTGTPVVARNAAESYISGGNGFADADGRNSSSTLLNLPIVVGGDCGAGKTCQIDFNFLADPYIETMLSAIAGPGSVARGVLSLNVSLRKTGALADTFTWAPNGCQVGDPTCTPGIIGGTEIVASPENLNLTVTQLTLGTTKHSPAYMVGDFKYYEAISNGLSKGEYVLSLSMIEKTDVKNVPEPATLALLGMGLFGLGFARRNKQA